MKTRVPHAVVAVLLGLAMWTVSASAADVEVVPNGPVHEAFAQPEALPLAPPALIDKQPPEPLDETMPSEKPDQEGVQWIGGYWAYIPGDKDYVWVSGIWRVPPPGRQWLAGYWNEVKGKWQRVRGYWAVYSPDAPKQEATYLPAPPPLKAEPRGERPDAASVYIPGAWNWSDAAKDYTWESGSWVAAQPGWSWVSPRYNWTPAGYTGAGGYWDYDPAKRGVIFAPVRVSETVIRRPGFSYVPAQAVLPSAVAGYLSSDPGSTLTFNNARFTSFRSLPNLRKLTAVERNDLVKLSRDLREVRRARIQAERRLGRDPRTTVHREPYNLPGPRRNVNVNNVPRHPRYYRPENRNVARNPGKNVKRGNRLTAKPGVKRPAERRKAANKPVARNSARKKPASKAKAGSKKSPKKKAGKAKKGGKKAGKAKKGGKKAGKAKKGGKKKAGKAKKGGKGKTAAKGKKKGGKKKGGKKKGGKKGGKKKGGKKGGKKKK